LDRLGCGLYHPAVCVLLMSAEDGLRDTIVPRLIRMNADRRMIKAATKPIKLDLPGCTDIRNVMEIERPRLVIIDPLFAYTGGNVDIHRANETREIMARLAWLADH